MRHFLGILSCILYLMHITSGQECVNKVHRSEVDKCCDFPSLFTPLSVYQRQGCLAKYKDVTNNNDKMLCLVECQTDLLGIIQDERVNLTQIRAHTKHMDAETLDVMLRLVEKCTRLAKEDKAIIAKRSSGKKCSYLAYYFIACLSRQARENCPDKYWSTNEICTKWDKGGYCN